MMTASQRQENKHRHTDPDTVGPSDSTVFPGSSAVPSPRLPPESDRMVRARPRSVEGDEAYHRSVLEQAAIDIAAGW